MTQEEKDKIEQKMEAHGLQYIPITELNMERAANDILIGEVLITRVLSMNAIYDGLNVLGLGRVLRSYPSLIIPIIFPTMAQVQISPEELKEKFQKGVQGCDSKEKEITLQWFFKFIDDSVTMQGIWGH